MLENVLPIKVSSKKIVFHIFIGNEVTRNSIGKIKIVLRGDYIVVAVHKHFPESLCKAIVACMLMETDALADRTAFKHHSDWGDEAGNKIIIIIIIKTWETLDEFCTVIRVRQD